MHLRRHVRKPVCTDLNLASMVDVVFLLLVFFMCTSSFQRAESDLPTPLPETGSRGVPSDEDFEPIRVRLATVPDGVLVTCDGQPCQTFDTLLRRLRARRALADVPVLVAGDDGVPFRYMVAAVDTCYRAQLRRVAFSAKEDRR